MAVCSSLSVVSANSAPRLISNPLETRVSFLNLPKTLSPMPSKLCGNQWKNRRLTKLNRAGLSQIEPDLNEDPVDRWATNSVSPVRSLSLSLCATYYVNICMSDFLWRTLVFQDDFKYGEYDGHHTYNEGEEKGIFARFSLFTGAWNLNAELVVIYSVFGVMKIRR